MKRLTEEQTNWIISKLVEKLEVKHRYSEVAHEFEREFGMPITRQGVWGKWAKFVGKYDVNVTVKFKEKK